VGKGLERVHDFGCGLELLPKRFHIVCLEMERPVNIALSKGMGALGAEIINSTSSLPNVAAIGLVEQLELECLGKNPIAAAMSLTWRIGVSRESAICFLSSSC
jgi:hypothetical protein